MTVAIEKLLEETRNFKGKSSSEMLRIAGSFDDLALEVKAETNFDKKLEYEWGLSGIFGHLIIKGIAPLVSEESFVEYCKKNSGEAYAFFIENTLKNINSATENSNLFPEVVARQKKLAYQFLKEYSEKYSGLGMPWKWLASFDFPEELIPESLQPLPWTSTYQNLKLSGMEEKINLPFDLLRDLLRDIELPNPVFYGKYDEPTESTYVYAYTGRIQEEENTAPAYDGYGRYDRSREITEGYIDNKGQWIRRPEKRFK